MATNEIDWAGLGQADAQLDSAENYQNAFIDTSKQERMDLKRQEKIDRLGAKNQNSNLTFDHTVMPGGNIESNANKIWNNYTDEEIQYITGYATSEYYNPVPDSEDARRTYLYGTKDGNTKVGVSTGGSNTSDVRYDNTIDPRYQQEWRRSGDTGPDLNQKHMDIGMDFGASTALEGLYHGNERLLDQRKYKDYLSNESLSQDSGVSEYYTGGVDDLMGDSSNYSLTPEREAELRTQFDQYASADNAQNNHKKDISVLDTIGDAASEAASLPGAAVYGAVKGVGNLVDIVAEIGQRGTNAIAGTKFEGGLFDDGTIDEAASSVGRSLGFNSKDDAATNHRAQQFYDKAFDDVELMSPSTWDNLLDSDTGANVLRGMWEQIKNPSAAVSSIGEIVGTGGVGKGVAVVGKTGINALRGSAAKETAKKAKEITKEIATVKNGPLSKADKKVKVAELTGQLTTLQRSANLLDAATPAIAYGLDITNQQLEEFKANNDGETMSDARLGGTLVANILAFAAPEIATTKIALGINKVVSDKLKEATTNGVTKALGYLAVGGLVEFPQEGIEGVVETINTKWGTADYEGKTITEIVNEETANILGQSFGGAVGGTHMATPKAFGSLTEGTELIQKSIDGAKEFVKPDTTLSEDVQPTQENPAANQGLREGLTVAKQMLAESNPAGAKAHLEEMYNLADEGTKKQLEPMIASLGRAVTMDNAAKGQVDGQRLRANPIEFDGLLNDITNIEDSELAEKAIVSIQTDETLLKEYGKPALEQLAKEIRGQRKASTDAITELEAVKEQVLKTGFRTPANYYESMVDSFKAARQGSEEAVDNIKRFKGYQESKVEALNSGIDQAKSEVRAHLDRMYVNASGEATIEEVAKAVMHFEGKLKDNPKLNKEYAQIARKLYGAESVIPGNREDYQIAKGMTKPQYANELLGKNEGLFEIDHHTMIPEVVAEYIGEVEGATVAPVRNVVNSVSEEIRVIGNMIGIATGTREFVNTLKKQPQNGGTSEVPTPIIGGQVGTPTSIRQEELKEEQGNLRTLRLAKQALMKRIDATKTTIQNLAKKYQAVNDPIQKLRKNKKDLVAQSKGLKKDLTTLYTENNELYTRVQKAKENKKMLQESGKKSAKILLAVADLNASINKLWEQINENKDSIELTKEFLEPINTRIKQIDSVIDKAKLLKDYKQGKESIDKAQLEQIEARDQLDTLEGGIEATKQIVEGLEFKGAAKSKSKFDTKQVPFITKGGTTAKAIEGVRAKALTITLEGLIETKASTKSTLAAVPIDDIESDKITKLADELETILTKLLPNTGKQPKGGDSQAVLTATDASRTLIFDKIGEGAKINRNVAVAMYTAGVEQLDSVAARLIEMDDDTIEKFYGVDPETLTAKDKEALQQLGVPIKYLAATVGEGVMQLLGYKINSTSGTKDKKEKYDRLVRAMGGNVLELMEAKGLTKGKTYKFNEVQKLLDPDKEIDKSKDEVKVHMVTFDKSTGVKAGNEHKAITAEITVPNTVKNVNWRAPDVDNHEVTVKRSPMTKPSKEMANIIKDYMNTEWHMKTNSSLDWLMRQTDEKIALYHGYVKEEDMAIMSVRGRRTAEGKNAGIMREIKAMKETYNAISNGEQENSMWFDYFVSKNHRAMLDSAGFNPQTGKLHRSMTYTKQQETEVDVNNDDLMRTFELAIAQSMGFEIDKREPEKSREFARKVLAEKDLGKKINGMFKNNEHKIEMEDGSVIEVEVLTHFLDGVEAIRAYNNRDADGKFTTQITFEADAVTSGSWQKTMQVARPGNQDDIDTLEKSGMRVDGNTGEFTERMQDDDFYDNYQDAAKDMTNDKMVDALTGSYHPKGKKKPVLDGVLPEETAMPLLTEVLNNVGLMTTVNQDTNKIEVTSAGRKLVKPPFMTFRYGAGQKKMKIEMSIGMVDGLVDQMIAYKLGKPLDGKDEAKNKIKTESIEAILKLIDSQNTLTADKLINTDISEVMITPKDGKEVTLEAVLSGLIKESYGNAIVTILDDKFGHETEINNAVNAAMNATFKVWKMQFDKKIEEHRLAGGVAIDDIERVIEELNYLFPIINSPFSKAIDEGVAVFKDRLTSGLDGFDSPDRKSVV